MIRIRSIWSGGPGGTWLSTSYWRSATEDAVAAQTAATAFRTFWDSIKAVFQLSYTVSPDPAAAIIDPATGAITGTFAVATTPVTGTNVNPPLPDVAQGVLQLRTNVFTAGRELRGRLFVPGMTTNALAGGNLTAAVQATVNSAGATLVGHANPGWVVWSRKSGTTQPVVAATLWPEFGVLRSRRD